MRWTIVDEIHEMDYGMNEIKMKHVSEVWIEGNEMKHEHWSR